MESDNVCFSYNLNICSAVIQLSLKPFSLPARQPPPLSRSTITAQVAATSAQPTATTEAFFLFS
ncbi:hypothetical protein NC651_034931 [Populus alba x Populus x berolinensis]|nr:hypothetical protein NC651_034931 [Populus alba x Populus x berolinensis]